MEIKARALARGEEDCPICMMELSARPTVVLSCAHLFHTKCLTSFENFNRDSVVKHQHDHEEEKDHEGDENQEREQGKEGLSCPMCRESYRKTTIDLTFETVPQPPMI